MDELSAAIEAAAAAAAASSQEPPEQAKLPEQSELSKQPEQQEQPKEPEQPKSPEVKMEIKPEPVSPEVAPPSPVKRARSPNEDAETSNEKRQKLDVVEDQSLSKSDPLPLPDLGIEPTTELDPTPVADAEPMTDIDPDNVADMDEITKMIQAAQEAALADQVAQDHPASDFHNEVNGIGGDEDHTHHDLDLNSIMASITNSLDAGGDLDTNGDLLNHDSTNDPLALPDLSASLQATPKKTTIWSNRAQYTRQTYILPTLGKVAVDILIALSEQPLEDTITALNDPDNSTVGKEYVLLRSFFDSLRKQLSEDFPLLYPDQLDISSPEDREIIRIANLATSCASMFGANELGWPDLNTSFLSTFVAGGQQMATEEADLYLGLKTQMFLTLLESEQSKPRNQILEELFVTGQEDSLKKHHPDLPLAQSETKFLTDAEVRKAMLLNESHDQSSILALSQQYTYEAFLDELSTYLDKHMGNIEKLGSSPTSVSADAESTGLFDGVNGLDSFDIDAAIAEAAKAASEAVGTNGTSNNVVAEDLAALISYASEQAQGSGSTEMSPAVLSTSESAMRATNLALQTMQRNQYHPTTVQQSTNGTSNGQHVSHQPQQQAAQQPAQQQQYYAYSQQANGGVQQAQGSDRVELPPGQHASSEILYERARQAAAARSSTHARREGSHSTRRPWSPEEEKALMMGLDMVKGPHWSQILSLFGQQGRMSTILADRTQVQLKDKARNLKLFFLKTNSEMPYYLQCVTGELKTRAPTQAARKEAEERARLTSDPDDQARVSATMALGSLHNGNPARPQPKPSPSKPGIPGQVGHHSHAHPAMSHASQLQRTASGHVAAHSPTHSVHNSQHVQLAQAAQKNHVNGQPAHTHHMQQVAPRPPHHAQNQVPLKPQPSQQPPLQPQNAQQQTLHNHQRAANPVHHQTSLHQQHQQHQRLQHTGQPQSQAQRPLQQQPQQPPRQVHPQPQQHASHTPLQQQQQKPLQPQPAQHQPQPQHQPQTHSHLQHQPTSTAQTHNQHAHAQTPQAQQAQPPVQPHAQAPAQSQTPAAAPPKPEDHGIKHEPLNDEEAGLLELKRFMSQENSAESQDQSIEAALLAASAAVAAQPTR
ncbi:hypothetical protein G7054_g9548 [Neopestalotiopsis clavispora]|nr:hypothetical protein G7054_g9548 [Neopestalotiopsis clavispora]